MHHLQTSSSTDGHHFLLFGLHIDVGVRRHFFPRSKNECHLSVAAGATASGHSAQSQVLWAYETVLLGYLHPLSRMVERLRLATRGSFRLDDLAVKITGSILAFVHGIF